MTSNISHANVPESTFAPALKIMLLDDHIIFSEGLAELLKKISPDCQTNIFISVEKAMENLKINQYNFLITDLLIPGYNVRDLITHCKENYPRLNVIVLSSVMEANTVKELLAKGIDGYLSKALNYTEMKIALEKIYNGEKYISSDISVKLATSFFEETKSPLTKKELEILRMVAGGHSVVQTAEKLFISSATVMAHRRNIMTKLDLHSAAELVKYAYDNKLT